MLILLYYPYFFSIYKSCAWIKFFQGTVTEMVFNNEIQIFFFSIEFTFLKKEEK